MSRGLEAATLPVPLTLVRCDSVAELRGALRRWTAPRDPRLPVALPVPGGPALELVASHAQELGLSVKIVPFDESPPGPRARHTGAGLPRRHLVLAVGEGAAPAAAIGRRRWKGSGEDATDRLLGVDLGLGEAPRQRPAALFRSDHVDTAADGRGRGRLGQTLRPVATLHFRRSACAARVWVP